MSNDINFNDVSKLKAHYRNKGLKVLAPQPGFQEQFCSTEADIAIGGGAAGVGKSFVLFLMLVPYTQYFPRFRGIVFRNTRPQLVTPGGLWDKAKQLYNQLPGRPEPNQQKLTLSFPNGSVLGFSFLQHEKDRLNHDGAEYCFIGFDELQWFSPTQFWYLQSRNRSTSGVTPFTRGTCNPAPDSFLRDLVDDYIDDDGFPISSMAGKIRYLARIQDFEVWGDSKGEVLEKAPDLKALAESQQIDPYNLVNSFTFIPGSIFDNKIFLKEDPGYLAKLSSLSEAEKNRLLYGNWNASTDLARLADYDAVSDMFSNYMSLDNTEKYITVDAARQGRDFAVICVWVGWYVEKMEVLTKSTLEQIKAPIENARKEFNIPASKVWVDQDGVGGYLVDAGNYRGYSGGGSALPDPAEKRKRHYNSNGQLVKKAPKENYEHLKAQCYYRFCERRVNAGKVGINIHNIYVDGKKSQYVNIGSRKFPIKQLIIRDFSSAKRRDMNKDGPKRILKKEDQKLILNGRSPDFIDSMTIREIVELLPKRNYSGYDKLKNRSRLGGEA